MKFDEAVTNAELCNEAGKGANKHKSESGLLADPTINGIPPKSS